MKPNMTFFLALRKAKSLDRTKEAQLRPNKGGVFSSTRQAGKNRLDANVVTIVFHEFYILQGRSMHNIS